LIVQPIRSKAARTCFALLLGQLLTPQQKRYLKGRLLPRDARDGQQELLRLWLEHLP